MEIGVFCLRRVANRLEYLVKQPERKQTGMFPVQMCDAMGCFGTMFPGSSAEPAPQSGTATETHLCRPTAGTGRISRVG